MPDSELKQKAINLVLSHINCKGDDHGPVINARPLGGSENAIWEVEIAHFGETGRSETCDPPSRCYQVNFVRNEIRLIDLM